MRRTLWMVVTFAVVGLWLVFAHGPRDLLPTLAYPAWSRTLAPALAVGGLVAFLAIQLYVTWSTDKALTSPRRRELIAEFRLRRGREFVLTILPVGMTLLVAVVAVVAAWNWAAWNWAA